LRKYDKDIIINGGDVFVSKLIKDKKTELIDGVNQECVFSRIEDYDRDRFKKQEKSEVKYFQSYLKKVKKSGLKIFLLEYTKDRKLKKKIADYCDRKEYGYYISESVKLY
jgi:endo-alpha-1,4-polygalactosaminidase (GH114 family)